MRHRNRRGRGNGGARGFTLIEPLGGIAIIALLMTPMFPQLRGATERARELQCAHQVRQLGLLCLSYAQQNKSLLPLGDHWNPACLWVENARPLHTFMQSQGVSSNLWYCPQLDDAAAKPAEWMTSGAGKPPLATNEFRIGYFYLGGLTEKSHYKFVTDKPFDSRRMDGPRSELLFDFCATRDGFEPPTAADVPVGWWYTFPHASRVRPKLQNMLMTDFSLERRMKDQLTLGYRYVYFQMRVYW